ncbi:MAG: 16S rRNA (adenine(1518)-N(6)/adenine(1519)-N(6))-dimethyltransferase RsmA [Lentimicrobiaceae bacterium]|nr:16S rRNA (adenine(1518)-N(6)/adenine(1519)-N(6))-dimethyltransferase RsmA [Lentimicrobiaceae bacterium]
MVDTSRFVRAKKHLGQHFLKDDNIARKIVGNLSPGTKNVLEIGAGTGKLTQYLLQQPFENFYIIEIDTESVDYLLVHYPELAPWIISGDFLKVDITRILEGNFSLIGNFPYNISSQIFFKVLENRNLVTEVVGMVQKEVAERIAAPPGSKTYGILSVLLQAFYTIEYLFTVNENVFSPPPRVKSAVVRLKRNTVQQLDCDEIFFFKVVKTAFNQRRKTLRNALKGIATKPEVLQSPVFELRAEQLSVADFVNICRML